MNGHDHTDEKTRGVASLARDAVGDEAKLSQLLALVGDRSAAPMTRLAALQALQELGFTSMLLKRMNAQLIETLRSVVDDPDQAVRKTAIEMLAQRKDELVQQRLLDGLERRDVPLVDDRKALQYLGYDIHAVHFPTVRKFASESPDPETRREAVKLLAADTESADLLFAIFDDKSADEELRRASAGALLSVAPQTFAQRAKEVVLDDTEVESVRAASLTALTHSADPGALASDTDFIERVANVATRGPMVAESGRSARAAAPMPAGGEGDLAKAVRLFKQRHGVK